MKRKAYLTVSIILIAVTVFSCFMSAYAASTTDAAEKVELRTDCSLNITYSGSGVDFAGQNIRLWHIADITAKEQYALVGAFADYPVEITGTSSQSEWNEMTVTLNSYILADGISPDRTAATDANGNVTFEDLTAGMYLVGSLRTQANCRHYVFESFMVAVPGVGEDGKWLYNVSAKPKMGEDAPSKGDVTYKAVKMWKDNGKDRPDSVSIEVYKDGELQHTAELCSENNWTYSWTTVDDGSVWSVKEKEVPEGYTVGIQQNGDTFSIINSGHRPGDDPSKTGDTADMTLWLALAAACGALIVLFGVLQRKKRREE